MLLQLLWKSTVYFFFRWITKCWLGVLLPFKQDIVRML